MDKQKMTKDDWRQYGIDLSMSYLKRHGLEVLDRSPSSQIDLVCWEKYEDVIVFVRLDFYNNVMERKSLCPRKMSVRTRLREEKLWLRSNKWVGNYRTDSISCYDVDIGKPVVDWVKKIR